MNRQGRRRETPEGQRISPPDQQPGDYWKDADGLWWCVVPSGDIGALSEHDITEYEDGTITVSPSILVHGEHGWHGFLEHGVWRDA